MSLSSFEEVRMTTGIALVAAVLFENPQDLPSIQLGQLQVQQYQPRRFQEPSAGVRAVAEEKIQRLFAVPRDVNPIH